MTELDNKLKLASKWVAQGRLSRHDFMQLALAAGFTATASNALFVRAARAEPKKGGILKMAVGHGQTTDSLDPATWSNGFTFGFGPSAGGWPDGRCSAPMTSEGSAKPRGALFARNKKKVGERQWMNSSTS